MCWSNNVITDYRPPSGNKDAFNEILNEIDELTTDRTIILGDFNLPHYDWIKYKGNNQIGEILTEYIYKFGFTQHVTEPTRKSSAN